MHMNFGPLSRQGGYRRLNVAITRAKYNVKLVGSIDPTDIDLERTSADGVRMLRLYMEYALHGPQALERELKVSGTPQFDSRFEEAVYHELTRLGYEVDTQVGCSGYRIDLAIKHPTRSGHYLLGIECDGATYHSAKTARDRDRLREDVLRGLGWTIHRVWSRDWVKDPKAEVERVVQAAEEALRQVHESPKVPDAALEEEPQVPLEVTLSPEEEAALLEGLPGTVEYVEADIWSVDRKPGQGDPEYVTSVVDYVISFEGPIHIDLLTKRLAPLFGKERVGSQIRRHVQWVVQQFGKRRWVVQGEFLWPANLDVAPVRVPGEKRSISHVCVEEQAEAVMLILERAVGMGLDELIVETARLLGFSRTGGQIREAVLAAVTTLESAGRVEMVDSIVRQVRRSGGR